MIRFVLYLSRLDQGPLDEVAHEVRLWNRLDSKPLAVEDVSTPHGGALLAVHVLYYYYYVCTCSGHCKVHPHYLPTPL